MIVNQSANTASGIIEPTKSGEWMAPADARLPSLAVAADRNEAPSPSAITRLVRLDPGLYAVAIGAMGEPPGEISGMSVPSIHLSAPPCDDLDPVEIIAGSEYLGSWVGAAGGTIIVRSPPGGGRALITAYLPPDRTAAPFEIEVRRLDRAAGAPALGEPPARPSRTREIPTEISLHIEKIGDRRFPGQGWVGTRGQRLRIEAFGMQVLEQLTAADIEYKGFAPNGRETPWVSSSQLCGTRGQGLPLTGFAVRPAARLQGRCDVVYQGSFFEGGIVGPKRNGEICTSPVADDPLEAVNIRIIERTGG